MLPDTVTINKTALPAIFDLCKIRAIDIPIIIPVIEPMEVIADMNCPSIGVRKPWI